MDIKAFFSNLWKKLNSLIEKAADYFRENKLQAFIISGLIALIFLLLIFLGIAVSFNKKKNTVAQEKTLVLTESPLIPTGPEVQEDYSVSRMSKDKWSEDEADEWFSIPTEKDIQSLGNSNDKIVSDIIGAAP